MNNPADDETNPEMIPAILDTGLNDREMRRQVIAQKLVDAQTPGFQAEFAPDEAELLGAFKEDALNETDALDSSIDQPESTDGGQ
mgnify:CR=1 FL=1|jgi:flagellar basal body rod protein FlgB